MHIAWHMVVFFQQILLILFLLFKNLYWEFSLSELLSLDLHSVFLSICWLIKARSYPPCFFEVEETKIHGNHIARWYKRQD